MNDNFIEHNWQSLHSDYLQFAIISLKACREDENTTTAGAFVNRNVIEAIRYSYDCLEASIEYVFNMGSIRQLRITIPDNWLSRYMDRKWGNFSLSDRIGMLTFDWMDQSFWKKKEQFRLFLDLKKVRDGLTHPIPFGEEEIKNENGEIIREKPLKPDWLIDASKSVANFELSPDRLGEKDAEQAIEILLHHLIRIENLFFGGRNTELCFYDSEQQKIITTEEMLGIIKCRFNTIWES